eukprot:TRINITY_DN3442_c0_g2_i9.p1 TRINITY_DN3442_c0_g2~~TRINITY_DN3442_c0_g2_i9.p1  ORF type:complete len:284 (+),score=12.12 TRINITY_DN3442_c0_g2_i9:113-964(+)
MIAICAQDIIMKGCFRKQTLSVRADKVHITNVTLGNKNDLRCLKKCIEDFKNQRRYKTKLPELKKKLMDLKQLNYTSNKLKGILTKNSPDYRYVSSRVAKKTGFKFYEQAQHDRASNINYEGFKYDKQLKTTKEPKISIVNLEISKLRRTYYRRVIRSIHTSANSSFRATVKQKTTSVNFGTVPLNCEGKRISVCLGNSSANLVNKMLYRQILNKAGTNLQKVKLKAYLVRNDQYNRKNHMHSQSLHRVFNKKKVVILQKLSLIHICRCRRYAVCRSRWSPYH